MPLLLIQSNTAQTAVSAQPLSQPKQAKLTPNPLCFVRFASLYKIFLLCPLQAPNAICLNPIFAPQRATSAPNKAFVSWQPGSLTLARSHPLYLCMNVPKRLTVVAFYSNVSQIIRAPSHYTDLIVDHRGKSRISFDILNAFPSLHPGFPNSVLQGMASSRGRPLTAGLPIGHARHQVPRRYGYPLTHDVMEAS